MHASSGNLKNLKPHRPLSPKTPARKTKHPHTVYSNHYNAYTFGGVVYTGVYVMWGVVAY